MDNGRENHPAAPGYERAADEAVARLCGVGYFHLVEMAPGLDPDRRELSRFAESGSKPEVFAEHFRSMHHMVRCDDDTTAVAVNERRAALVEFASGGRWNMNEEGSATLDTASGTVCLDVIERDGRLGFGARRVEDPETDAYVRLDIGDTVRGFLLRLRQDREIAPEIDAPSAPGMRPG